ncbi:ladderlectin-like isoform X1 [Thunnus albacares]|uniref:ladderlectin-like isoform X1 n=1 Tax=Thunnus albacares TaxID=8236 RepID=UPI001CF6CE4E|nr:ladderlectin-like isoform X1 [Thunnus albacares]
MKMLTVAALICTIMALTTADAPPEAKIQNDQTAEADLVKRIFWCSYGWKKINGRCFRYVPTQLRWVDAEKACQAMGGNLASVHTYGEYHKIQMMIIGASHVYRPAWIGGSDAQQENVWLWSNGRQFNYRNWCYGQPNNFKGRQNCLTMNSPVTARRCWNDDFCYKRKPSVCVKNRW